MHRKALLDLLARYRGIDSQDQGQCQRIIDFVSSTPDCFERSHLAGHVTGSVWLLDKRAERVLLTHHRKLDRWMQLGGHADGNPNLQEVALKEAQEESGINDIWLVDTEILDVDIHQIPEHSGVPAHLHYDVRFAIQTNHPEALRVSHESKELAWVTLDELEHFNVDESLLRMRRKWCARPSITSS